MQREIIPEFVYFTTYTAEGCTYRRMSTDLKSPDQNEVLSPKNNRRLTKVKNRFYNPISGVELSGKIDKWGGKKLDN